MYPSWTSCAPPAWWSINSGLAATGEQAREHVRAAIRDVHGAVPDISFTIEDFAEQGDKIWVRVRARGIASGTFFGPPSNKPIDITVFDLARVANGQIIEHWGVPHRFASLAQTGSPCSRRPGCSTGWRADSVIAVSACVPPAADRHRAVLRASMVGSWATAHRTQ